VQQQRSSFRQHGLDDCKQLVNAAVLRRGQGDALDWRHLRRRRLVVINTARLPRRCAKLCLDKLRRRGRVRRRSIILGEQGAQGCRGTRGAGSRRGQLGGEQVELVQHQHKARGWKRSRKG